jgi:hypothetical protein
VLLRAADQKAPQVGAPFKFAHVSPVLHVRLATAPTPQHSCPIPPHATQRRVAPAIAGAQLRFAPWQVNPAPVAAGQHACPAAAPHAVHMPGKTAVAPVHSAPV